MFPMFRERSRIETISEWLRKKMVPFEFETKMLSIKKCVVRLEHEEKDHRIERNFRKSFFPCSSLIKRVFHMLMD